MTSVQVMALCGAIKRTAAARARPMTAATRTWYGQRRATAQATREATSIAGVLRSRITPIPMPRVCAVSLDLKT